MRLMSSAKSISSNRIYGPNTSHLGRSLMDFFITQAITSRKGKGEMACPCFTAVLI